jgi:DNA-binding NarL/FixJ family response regulator
MINIVIVEDDAVYRSELESTIHFQPNWLCLMSSPSAEHFKTNLPPRARIDIAFVDINLPGESGIQLIPFLAGRAPDAQIIMISHLEDGQILLKALNMGADGYLIKNFSMTQLPQFVKIILEGGALISPVMARHLVNYLNPGSGTKTKDKYELTAKENQVLRLISEGNSYNEAADLLGISIDGIRFHIKRIYKKMGVNNRIEALNKWNEDNNL